MIRIALFGCSANYIKRLENSRFFDVSCVSRCTGVEDLAMDADLYLIDADFSDGYGFALARQLRRHSTTAPLILLGQIRTRRFVAEALMVGANAYCVKGVSAEELMEIYQVVDSKKVWIAPPNAFTMQLESEVVSLPAPPVALRRSIRANPLSDRELQILKLVAMGYSNRRIGNELDMSVETIKTHLRSIFSKLFVENRVMAVVQALRCGFFF